MTVINARTVVKEARKRLFKRTLRIGCLAGLPLETARANGRMLSDTNASPWWKLSSSEAATRAASLQSSYQAGRATRVKGK
jgi:hypothetical protein